jgi:hypothetical protein
LRVHPGRHWSTVLSGTVVLRPGERTILVQAGETAQFSTMAPQASGAHDRAAEILCILGHDGERALRAVAHAIAPRARHPRYSDEWRMQPAREPGRPRRRHSSGIDRRRGAPNSA